MEKEFVYARYEKIWNGYLSALAKKPHLLLSSFLKSRRVGLHSYENWMCRKFLSAHQVKAKAISPMLRGIRTIHIHLPLTTYFRGCKGKDFLDIFHFFKQNLA